MSRWRRSPAPAGVTKPVVYDLFGTLADLLEALLEREEERALLQLAELMPTPDADADPDELLVDGLDAFLRAVEARPAAWRLIADADRGDARDRPRAGRARADSLIANQLESIVRWGVERLNVPISDVELLVEALISLVEESGAQAPRRPRALSGRADHRLHRQPAGQRQALVR